MAKFVVLMPVEITVDDPTHIKHMWEQLKGAGGSCWSSDGWEFDLRTDRIKLKELREGYRRVDNATERP